jgi:hypothetical protein
MRIELVARSCDEYVKVENSSLQHSHSQLRSAIAECMTVEYTGLPKLHLKQPSILWGDFPIGM